MLTGLAGGVIEGIGGRGIPNGCAKWINTGICTLNPVIFGPRTLKSRENERVFIPPMPTDIFEESKIY
jgi:hypothetical protein